MRTSEDTVELLTALQAADLANPTKGSKGQIRGRADYWYAGLPDILEAVTPALKAQGLLLLQEAGTWEGQTAILTRLTHTTTGQWIEYGPLAMPHAADPQAVGSAITYARRYQLLAALGLAAEDDDGAQASPPPRQAERGQPSAAPVQDASTGAGQPPASAGAPNPETQQLLDQLKRLAGSAAAAREQVNRTNGTTYTVRTLPNAPVEQVRLAVAEWLETHPEAATSL